MANKFYWWLKNFTKNFIWFVWDICIFDNFTSFGTCQSVSYNLRGKLVSSTPVIFDDSLKTTSVPFFVVADFSLSSCEIDTFMFEQKYIVLSPSHSRFSVKLDILLWDQ